MEWYIEDFFGGELAEDINNTCQSTMDWTVTEAEEVPENDTSEEDQQSGLVWEIESVENGNIFIHCRVYLIKKLITIYYFLL